MIKILPFLLIIIWGCGKPIEGKDKKFLSPLINEVHEKDLLKTRMSLNFNYLPLKGKIKGQSKFWSGNSWRLNRGAINYRWNSPNKETIGYPSPTSREIFSMPLEKLKELSPSEKYDLYRGRYDFPLKNDIEWISRKDAEDWEGLCHGWAGASLNHPEPRPKNLMNPDGLLIPFGSSDIKALLSYAYSTLILEEDEFLGFRCEDPKNEIDYCHEDLSAGDFHVVLTNLLGLRGKSFVADLERYQEVWNHPITSYDSVILQNIKNKDFHKVIIRTTLTYLEVIEKNSWEPLALSKMENVVTFEYELALDKKGNISGSRWRTRERPDFLWIIPERENFKGDLSMIHDLLN